MLDSLIQGLGFSLDQKGDLRRLYLEAEREARAERERSGRPSKGTQGKEDGSHTGLPVTVVNNGGGGDVHIHQPPPTEAPRQAGAPPLVDDAAGHGARPDPLRACTREEFVTTLRAFWLWAGAYSPRQLSAWSRGGPHGKVSHTTLNALLAEAPHKRPPMTLKYVQTIIHCCGGGEADLQHWTTAWRRIYAGIPYVGIPDGQPKGQPEKLAEGQTGGRVVRLPTRTSGRSPGKLPPQPPMGPPSPSP
ncbi:hypothetical protein [Actinomadura graeca]|nr:hypothetical protein [Actinomadura graeca]